MIVDVLWVLVIAAYNKDNFEQKFADAFPYETREQCLKEKRLFDSGAIPVREGWIAKWDCIPMEMKRDTSTRHREYNLERRESL